MANAPKNAGQKPTPLPGQAPEPVNEMAAATEPAPAAPAPTPPVGFGGNTFEPPVDVDAAGEGEGEPPPPPEKLFGGIGGGARPRTLDAAPPPRMPMPSPLNGEVTEDPETKAQTDAEIEAEIRRRWGVGAENRRVPFALGKRLPEAKRRGFHRHVFNDVPGRIAQAERAGYKHVTDSRGDNIVTVVGTSPYGGPLHGYLMEIPEAWFREDMARGQDAVDEVDAAIRGGNIGAKEGDGRYASGIRIEREDD